METEVMGDKHLVKDQLNIDLHHVKTVEQFLQAPPPTLHDVVYMWKRFHASANCLPDEVLDISDIAGTISEAEKLDLPLPVREALFMDDGEPPRPPQMSPERERALQGRGLAYVLLYGFDLS
jgi:hypothetical protein